METVPLGVDGTGRVCSRGRMRRSKGRKKRKSSKAAGSASQKLNDRQKLFISAYVANRFNATKAAAAAGYSAKAARQIGSRLLTNTAIRDAIRTHLEELKEEHKAQAWEVHRTLWRVLNFDFRKVFKEQNELRDIVDLDDDSAMALHKVDVTETITESADGQSVKRETRIKVGVPDKLRACELVARLGGYLDPKGGGMQGISAVQALVDEFQRWRKEAGEEESPAKDEEEPKE